MTDASAALLPDRRTTLIVAVAVVVGAAIAATAVGQGPGWAQVLRFPSYAVACALIVRFTTIVRLGLVPALVVHEVAMAGIVVSWLATGRPAGAVVNGLWLVGALVWFVGRRPER